MNRFGLLPAAQRRCRVRHQVLLMSAAVICLTATGCGKSSGPSAQELKRRQAQRESEAQSSRTIDEKLADVQAYLDDDNVVAAVDATRSLLISDPDHPGVKMMMAKCEAATGNALAAVKILDSIDNSDSQSKIKALRLAVDWCIDANQFDEAQSRLEQLAEIPSERIQAHRQLALILNNQGRRIEAAEHLRALAQSGAIHEKELIAMNCYSQPFIDDSMPKPDFDSQLVPAALINAKVLRVEGEMNRSRTLTLRLARAFPESTQIAAFAGTVHADFHDQQALRRWVQDLPEGIDREPEYWHALGVWLQREGKDREAVRCLGEAVMRDPTDEASYAALARSLRTLGEHEAAKRVIQRYEMLEEMGRITKSMGRRPGTNEELQRMAELLKELRRPFESVGFRKIALQMHGGSDSDLAALQREREQLLGKLDDPSVVADAEFLTCGLDLQQWPLPSEDAIGSEPQIESGNRVAVSVGPIVLTDVAAKASLEFTYDNGDDRSDDRELLHQLTGGGIGVIDFDLDGWSDLYFTQGGGDAFKTDSKPNRLFRNLAGKQFAAVTEPSQTGDRGYGQGVAAADVNQDGFLDLLVANIGINVMLINNGDGTFVSRPLPSAKPDGHWTTTIACGDLGGDHLPEMIDVNYVDDPTAMTLPCTQEETSCVPSGFNPAVDEIWQLQPNGAVTPFGGCQAAAEKPNYGFGAVIADFDGKPGNEMFIANDGRHNHYWVRQGESLADPLMESARVYGCDAGLLGELPGCMGIAFGDIDRNGTLDLHVTNFWSQPADLYLQRSNGLFSNGNVSRGLFQESRETVGWGTHAVDFDADGWLDLAVMNGHVHDYGVGKYKMRPQLFRGGPERFTSVNPDAAGANYWATPTLGRTLAVLDWNGDSKPDLVSNHLETPAALLENRTKSGKRFRMELIGTTSERDAIGAKVTISCGNQTWVAWVAGGDGFLCTNEPVLDFGIGDSGSVDAIEVVWPSGGSQQFKDIDANRQVLVIEGQEMCYQRR